MTLRFVAFDRAWRQVQDAAVDLRVCNCCPTTAAVTSDGPIAAFRDRSDDEVRDIHVARLENGRWTTPMAVHDDGWRLAACPVNGPMLSAHGRDVSLAWFTVVGDVGHAYAAFARDAGRTSGPHVRVDEAASLGRVDVELLPRGAAAVTWIELGQRGTALHGQAHRRGRPPTASGARCDAGRLAHERLPTPRAARLDARLRLDRRRKGHGADGGSPAG